jgi:hypothetical protein
LKTEFWERRAVLNLAAFRTTIEDYQATVTNGQLGVLRGYLANADKVRTQGFEFDFSVRPNARFNAYANGAYTDAKYVRFDDAPCPPELAGGTTVGAGQTPSAPGTPGGLSPANCDISGGRLPGVSKWSFAYGAEANTPLTVFGREGQTYIGFEGSYRSGFSSNPSPSAYTNVKGYALANFRAGGSHRRRPRSLRLGPQRFRRRVLRATGARPQQHRPDRRPAGRSPHLGRDPAGRFLSLAGFIKSGAELTGSAPFFVAIDQDYARRSSAAPRTSNSQPQALAHDNDIT